MKATLILGGPGCGKTTRLLQIVEQELRRGVRPDQIAFVSFTKAAAREAQQRAADLFKLTPESDLPWFRTIHSLAYKQLGISKDEVLGKREYDEFSRIIGTKFSHQISEDEPFITGDAPGDLLLRIVDYAATTSRTLQDSWALLSEDVDWHVLKQFDAAYIRYKTDTGRMDFTDMLLYYAAEGDPVPVQVAIIDEAQDLTHVQWQVVRRAFAGAERIYYGGDDDQAIYTWAGADVGTFLSLQADREVLPVSHRIPRIIHNFSQQIVQRIRTRYQKPYQSTNRPGTLEWHMVLESVNFDTPGTWLLLARNNYLTKRLVAMIRQQGYNYQTRHHPAVDPADVRAMRLWEELRTNKRETVTAAEARVLFKAMDVPVPQLRETQSYTASALQLPMHKDWYRALDHIPLSRRDFYLAVMRRGQKLSDPPRIRIETIHGVKGAEADHVLMMTDISLRTKRGMDQDPDAEHRVFYVGATRCRESLHILTPQTDLSYVL